MNEYTNYLKERFNIVLKNSDLLNQALIHPSYANEINNIYYHYERLEFMGDAILQFLVSEYIFNLYPTMPEGEMTVLRAKAVCEPSLALYATDYQMYDYLKVGKGELKTGGTHRESTLANVFESVLGAIYLSNGIDDARLYLSITFEYIKNDTFPLLVDYKTKLQEFVQADAKRTVTYSLVEAKGSPNNPIFVFKVLMDNIVLGYGQGNSKKRAQQQAAKDALDKMVSE